MVGAGLPIAAEFVDIVGHLFHPGESIEWTKGLHGWLALFQISPAVVVMGVSGLLCVLVFGQAAAQPGLIPRGRFRNMIEAMVLFVRNDICRQTMGSHGDRYVPIFLSVFFFILFNNILGLLPYSNSPTGNIAVTATLATMAFFFYHGAGMAEQGVGHYLGSIVPGGLPKLLYPLMLIVEVMGHFAKSAALAIRLFANMVGGHATILGLLGLMLLFGAQSQMVGYATAVAVVPMVVAIYFLELLVALIQAFIFTYLVAIFTGSAMHPDH